jgi:phosphotransferase system HPr-like phosphotransfer protein
VITIRATEKDEAEAVQALRDPVDSNFGEPAG